LDSYLIIAENSGVDLSFIYNYPVKIQFDNLPKDSEGTGDYLGFALGKDDDELVHIVIDYQYWSSMNDLQKTQLLYHELSHDILNAKHVSDETHLMHPNSEFKNIPMLIVAMTQIFKQFNESF
tara:strand:- start:71 stop:439 length:369 start_codon:yes stop_codon:yes gene_type:complete